MGGSLEARIKKLQEFFWSDSDPDGRAFVGLADAYRQEGNFSEALRILRDGLRRHPEMVSGHVVKGWALAEEGNSAEAEAAFRAALEIDAGNVSALRGLGECLEARGEAAEARDVFAALLPLDPIDTELPKRIDGLAAEAEAQARVSDEEVEEVLPEAEPQRPWGGAEDVAEELDWEGAALQADESAREEDPETPVGEVGAEPEGTPALDGEPAGGVDLYQAPTGDDALVTRTMGDIYLRQGLLDEAEEVYRQLLAKDPTDWELQAKLNEVEAARRGEVAPPLETGEVTPAEADEAGAPAALADAPGAGLEDPVADQAVPVDDLGPETIVEIGDLAPDHIVSIDELAPDTIVPIGALAPGREEGNATLDDFEAWLDELP